jgi:phosphoribosylamine--glycine ligase
MRFAMIGAEGPDVSMAARLLDEGHEVKCYCDKGKGRERSDTHAHVGEGILDLEQDYEAFVAWAEGAVESLVLFTTSGLGDKADELRERGLIVVGGGTFCDRLEKDRLFGQGIAEEAGCRIPSHQDFSSLSQVRTWAKTLDREVYFKTNKYVSADATRGCDNSEELIRYIQELRDQGVADLTAGMLQDKIPGVALSVGRWWNGRAFVGPWESTIELKAYGNDDFGPSTGCAANAVWFTEENETAIRCGFENLAALFRENDAPPCLYDINAIIDKDGQPWFLEWTPRMGYDSEPTSTRLIDDLGAWFWYVGTGQGGSGFSDELAYAVRLSIPPYPWEHVEWSDKKTCVGVRISEYGDSLWSGNFIAYQVRDVGKGLEMASPEGIVGLSLAQGDSLSELHEEVIAFADDIDCSGIYCRTDGAAKIAKIAETLKESGVAIHEGLVK